MQRIMEKLAAGGVIVGDGGWGSMILQRGLQRGHAPESVNLTNPEILREIAELYLAAGAEIITTNTFGGTCLKLQPYGLDAQADKVNRTGVEVIRGAVGTRALVSASVGPTGKLIQPKGKTTADEVYLNFERQIEALLMAAPDMLCIETMTDLEEAKLAIKAARALSDEIPIMATMTFNQNRRGFFTIMGDSVAAVAAGLEAAGANIIGSNCGNGSEKMLEIAAVFKQHTALPLVIQANAGLPSMQNGQTVYSETPEFMAENARRLLELGVQVIGGCCGTTPEHIRALRQVVDGGPGAAT